MELDGLTEEQIHAAIDWCQDDEFWAPNIRSVSKLRDKYLTLRTQAKRRPPAGRDSTTNARVAQGLDLAAQYEQRERALSSGRQREITGGE